jgi:hypothetical protein
VHAAKKTKTVKTANTGTAPLKVSAITLDGANGHYKAKTKGCLTTIATGDTCSFKVTFNPKSACKLNAKITVTTDGGVGTVKRQGMGLT